ncbi:MAG: hypothetical protein KAY02_07140 [Acidovorax sp.]|nr:hypothetical protein [Acidovorax sp.]
MSDPLELGEVQRLALLPVLRLVVLQEPLLVPPRAMLRGRLFAPMRSAARQQALSAT